MDQDERLTDSNDFYYNDLKKLALDKMTFYRCYKCLVPFYGGRNECGGDVELNKRDLICEKCKKKN